MNRYFVAGEIVIDEEADALVDDELLHQRGANSHGHRADHLATCRFWIEDAARGADGQHAPYADFGRGDIDTDFDEMRAKR